MNKFKKKQSYVLLAMQVPHARSVSQRTTKGGIIIWLIQMLFIMENKMLM